MTFDANGWFFIIWYVVFCQPVIKVYRLFLSTVPVRYNFLKSCLYFVNKLAVPEKNRPSFGKLLYPEQDFSVWSFRSRDFSVRLWNLAKILRVHFLMQTSLNQRKILFTELSEPQPRRGAFITEAYQTQGRTFLNAWLNRSVKASGCYGVCDIRVPMRCAATVCRFVSWAKDTAVVVLMWAEIWRFCCRFVLSNELIALRTLRRPTMHACGRHTRPRHY